LIKILAAGSAALAAAAFAAPASAQQDRAAAAASRFNDPVPERAMRAVPRGAAPSALVSRSVQGFAERTLDAFEAVPSIVVAPSGMSQGERDEFSRSFRATPDGYFARLTRDDYDVVINGTLAYTVAPASLRFQRRTGRYFIQKSEGETGISFSDFGGDYLIQFVCHEFTEGQVGGCVSDEEAVALFERIVPLGGGLE
jgi:hypothetical protein